MLEKVIIVMSVAERYNSLLREYQGLDRLDGVLTADKPSGRVECPRQHEGLFAGLISVLNEVSERMYLTEIAELAKEEKELPTSPLRWNTTGYVFANGLCYNGEGHRAGETTRIYNAALPRLQALVCEVRDTARGAFERYKLAVEQGVAVAE